jgi:biopolymer transport protein ExbD
LLDELKKLLKAEIDTNPKLRVMIREDGDVEYKLSEEVMKACADAGAVDMIFSAFEK